MEKTINKMSPCEAWLYAATWGSCMTSGDPGACMYGFDERCKPQSEGHRQSVLDWMTKQRLCVIAHPEHYGDNELEQIDSFVEFITERAVK